MAFWFCITHDTVEGDEGCRSKDRLGPYETEAEAARALETAAEKSAAWDNDPKWNDDLDEVDGTADGSGGGGS